MCGLAGYRGPVEVPAERVQDCLARMGHRGPDHAAWRSFPLPGGGVVQLLHTRLSIIDRDPRAHQPLQHGRHWLAVNGELYNYLELAPELEREGPPLVTRSDSEVLLRVLAGRGREGLAGCEGMWAFALHDERSGTLVLCRDRFGEKPLYLFRDPGGGLYFGSEPKFVAALLGRPLPPNLRHVRRYLAQGYRSLYKSGETFFAGLSELPAGAWLAIDGEGRERLERWWTPPREVRPVAGMGFAEAAEGVRERLLRAVGLRLRADVPLAFCLSGGVDSNALVAIASRGLGHPVQGFTIVTGDARYDERDAVAASVRELGIRHTEVPLDPRGFLEGLVELVRRHDAPVHTISYYVHWRLMESVSRAGYRVALSGTGADELFSGYYDHHLAYLAVVRGEDPELYAASRSAWEAHVQPLVRNPRLRDPDLWVRDPAFRDHLYLDRGLGPACLREPLDEPFHEEPYAADLLRRRMLNELFFEVVPVILHEDDLNAMSFSIENRSPFLDRELFEWSLRIPTRHLVRDGRAKAVLREALRGTVPATVLDSRRKVGFNAPLDELLDLRRPDVRARLLEPGPIFELVHRDRMEALLARPEPTEEENKLRWAFLNARIFLEERG